MNQKPKEVNLLAIGAAVVAVIVAAAVLLIFGGKDPDMDTEQTQPSGTTETTQTPTLPPETTVLTEPEIIYEKRTVYLCIRETMEQWDGSGFVEQKHTYDEYGNRIKSENVTHGGGREYTYDEWGNMLTEQSFADDGTLGSRTEYAYDESGNKTSQCYYLADGSLFSERTYSYDDAGRLLMEILAYTDETIRTEYIYSEDGTQCTENTYRDDVLSSYSVYEYDAAGLLIETNSYNASGEWGSRQTYEYDAQGRIAVEWNYSSRETQADFDVIYTYDENGLLVFKDVSYYYGYGAEYFYEAVEILVRVN